jgi:hypothetical protein
MNSHLFAVAIICFFLVALAAFSSNLTDSGSVYDIRASSIQENITNGNVTSSVLPSDQNNNTASGIQQNMTGMNATSYLLPSDQNKKTTGIEIDKRSYPAGILQIPYTGLVRNQITPEIASMLGLNSSTFGMIVSEVMPDSPAEEAGLYAGNITRSVGGNIIRLGGDIILAVDGNSSFIRSSDAYLHYLRDVKKVGENLTFTIIRDGNFKEVNLTLGAVPEFFWYDDPDEGIRIAYPSDWEVSEENLKRDDIVKFFSPEENPSNGLSTVGVFLKVSPAGEFGLDTLAQQETESEGPVRNLHLTFTDIGGLPAYESVLYNYGDQNRTLKLLSAFTIKDGDQIYRINYAADPWKYEEYLPIARKMIDSFQFTSLS